MEVVALNVVKRMQHRALATAALTWRAHAAEKRRKARVGERVLLRMGHLVLATASGHASKSEHHGYGQNEFVPWQLGAVM